MTKRNRGSSWLVAAVLLVGLLPVTAAARPPALGDADKPAPIEQALLDRLSAEGTADLFVKMAAEADLSAAFDIADWEARGRYVWDALQAQASASQAPVLEYARRHGLEHRSFLATNAVFFRAATLETAQALAALPGVAHLRLERELPLPQSQAARPAVPQPGAPDAVTNWGLVDTRATDLWALGYRGAGVKVAGIDTGVQWDHPALVDNYGCPDDPGNPACWYDPSNICGGAPCDNNGHGTHTMGTIVAKDDPSLPYIAGMAPDATWIACKGCEYNSCSEYALNACGDWVLAPGGEPANRPQVANNAWGGQGGDDWYMTTVQAWVAAGIFPAFAVGGSGPDCATIGSPSDYPQSFAVTAHGEDRLIASFAGRGPSAFCPDCTKPNICAPGVNVWSTVPDDDWDCYSGTSMSVAHGSGAALLVLSACPGLVGDVYGTFEVLQDNADTPPPGNCGAPPSGEGNYTYGYGFVNVLAAANSCASLFHLGPLRLRYVDLGGSLYLLSAGVRVLDPLGQPVAGIWVDGEWTRPNGAVATQQALTGANGVAQFRLRSRLTGTYQFCVLHYDARGNAQGSGEPLDVCKTIVVGP